MRFNVNSFFKSATTSPIENPEDILKNKNKLIYEIINWKLDHNNNDRRLLRKRYTYLLKYTNKKEYFLHIFDGLKVLLGMEVKRVSRILNEINENSSWSIIYSDDYLLPLTVWMEIHLQQLKEETSFLKTIESKSQELIKGIDDYLDKSENSITTLKDLYEKFNMLIKNVKDLAWDVTGRFSNENLRIAMEVIEGMKNAYPDLDAESVYEDVYLSFSVNSVYSQCS